MLFKYKAIDVEGKNKEGEIDAANRDIAISALQRRGFVVVSVIEEGEKKSIFSMDLFERVSMKDIVVLSRQIATLFEAQISALKAFSLLAENSENKLLSRKINQIHDDLQAGVSISGSFAKHPDIFSDFYVNMVKVGEETGKLSQTFAHLADYLDRQYALTTKTRNALIYPIFVIFVFFVVMILMFVFVIPKLSQIIKDSGEAIPLMTKIVIGVSDIFVNYGFFLIFFAVIFGGWVWSLSSSDKGKEYLDRRRLSIPIIGNLYKQLFLSRISDNLNTMLVSGVQILKAIDITSDVVGSRTYKIVLKNVADDVRAGLALSVALSKHNKEIPGIMTEMVKVGEETGFLGAILKTLAEFYKREVDNAVDTLVGLIEPVMIVVLGLGVGILLVSVLMPIYNLAGSIG